MAETRGYVGVREATATEPTPVEQLAERLTMRLTEDESLRSGLTDEEYQPLLDWATRKIGELAQMAARLPAPAAEAHFNRVGGQLLELLRVVDAAVGERQSLDPELVVGRLQLLDTLLTPPLLAAPIATSAQAQLELLLAEPPEALREAGGVELVGRIVDLLG